MKAISDNLPACANHNVIGLKLLVPHAGIMDDTEGVLVRERVAEKGKWRFTTHTQRAHEKGVPDDD